MLESYITHVQVLCQAFNDDTKETAGFLLRKS